MAHGSRTSRLPLVLAAIASILWLGLCSSVLLRELPTESYDVLALLALLQLAGTMLAGPAAFFALAAALLASRRPATPSSGLEVEIFGGANPLEALETAEARLTGIATRVDTVRAMLGADMEGFSATAATLHEQAENARATVASLQTGADAANTASERLSALLPRTTEVTERLGELLGSTGKEISRQCDAMDQAQQKLVSGAQLFGEMHQSVVTQGETLGIALHETQTRLDALGKEGARAISERLATLTRDAEFLEQRLAAQTGQTEKLAAAAERAFQLLDARIGHNETTSQAVLGRLGTRIAELSGGIDALAAPLKAGRAEVDQLETAVESLRARTLETAEALGTHLPATTQSAHAATQTMAEELRGLTHAIDAARGRATELLDPIQESRAAIDEAAAAYARQRAAIAAAGEALIVELNQARLLLAEVEQQTETTSLAAATRLLDTMARVHDVAAQTSTTVRNALENVIDDARASLSETAFSAMQQSFATPIADQAQAVQTLTANAAETARQAAERTATSMAALAGTLKQLDQRIATRTQELETIAQRDLLASAQFLVDHLSAHAFSLSSTLGKPMSDTDWTQWRKGERGMFNRRALSLLEKKDNRELRGLLETDAEFADIARRYTAEFDALLHRIDPSGENPLTPALLSSEYGRLAAGLSEALEG